MLVSVVIDDTGRERLVCLIPPQSYVINASVSKAALKSAEYQDKVAFIEPLEQKREGLLKALSQLWGLTAGLSYGAWRYQVSDDNVDSLVYTVSHIK